MAKRSKSEWIQVRITPAEDEALKQLAAEAGMSVSEYVRSKCLAKGVRPGLFRSTGPSRGRSDVTVPEGLRDAVSQ